MKSEKRRVDSKWKVAQIAKIEVPYLKSLLNVSLSASNSKLPASSVIREFSILKAFNVSIHPPKLLIVMEVNKYVKQKLKMKMIYTLSAPHKHTCTIICYEWIKLFLYIVIIKISYVKYYEWTKLVLTFTSTHTLSLSHSHYFKFVSEHEDLNR